MTRSANPVISTEACGPSQGAAVLDIGGDIGAAVVQTTAANECAEIEIAPHGSEWDGTHVAVRRRIGTGANTEAIFCAVFSSLPAGAYRVRIRDHAREHPSQLLTVKAARVVHVSL
jgi:hypothetical protein